MLLRMLQCLYAILGHINDFFERNWSLLGAVSFVFCKVWFVVVFLVLMAQGLCCLASCICCGDAGGLLDQGRVG